MFDPHTLRQLINEHGIVVTLKKRATGVYNSTTGVVAQTDTNFSVKGYFFNNDPSVGEFSTVFHGERRIVLSDKLTNGSVVPEVDASDEIVYNGKTSPVTRSSRIDSAGINMCQLLYLRD